METLTNIAVRLWIVCSPLLAILGFISLAILVGVWLSSRISPVYMAENLSAAADPMANIKWCDASQTVPYIPADHCGGGSSCDRSFLMAGQRPANWSDFCATLTKQLQ